MPPRFVLGLAPAVVGTLLGWACEVALDDAPSDLTWPNQPAGFQVVSDYAFGSLADSGWRQTDGPPDVNIFVDGSAPRSPPTVLEFRYPVGFAGGVGPGNAYYDIPQPWPRELYIGFWWKPSSPWQGHSSNVNKIMFVTTGGTQQAAIIKMKGVGSGPFDTQMTLEFPPATVNYNENRNAGGLTLGVWHKIEMYLRYNGGVLRWWVDGVLKGDYTGIAYPNSGFDGLKFQPTWGGTGDVKTQNDYFWVDHVHASRP